MGGKDEQKRDQILKNLLDMPPDPKKDDPVKKIERSRRKKGRKKSEK